MTHAWHCSLRTLFHSLIYAALLAATACAPTRPAPVQSAFASSLPTTPYALVTATGGPPVELPGARPDGSVLLPNQWSLRPVGRQVELGDFPINVAVHPGGRFAAVLHSGDSSHEIMVDEVIWRSVRGANHPMPAPVRAAFVHAHPLDKDDD